MRPFGLSQLVVGDPRELGLNRKNDPDPDAFFGFKRVLNPWVPPFSTITIALNKLGCGFLCCCFLWHFVLIWIAFVLCRNFTCSNHFLASGFKYFILSPQTLLKWSNLIFFNWVPTSFPCTANKIKIGQDTTLWELLLLDSQTARHINTLRLFWLLINLMKINYGLLKAT